MTVCACGGKRPALIGWRDVGIKISSNQTRQHYHAKKMIELSSKLEQSSLLSSLRIYVGHAVSKVGKVVRLLYIDTCTVVLLSKHEDLVGQKRTVGSIVPMSSYALTTKKDKFVCVC